MKKVYVILSSSLLNKRLSEALETYRESYKLELQKNRLFIEGCEYGLDVECRSEFIEYVRYEKMIALLNFLKQLQDQPITINFGELPDWIIILEATI